MKGAIKFVDISKKLDRYEYTYAVLHKSLFRKKYMKIVFTSDVPHYWWSDVASAMRQSNLFWETMVMGEPANTGIGIITYSKFSDSDMSKYSGDTKQWGQLLQQASRKQIRLGKDFTEEHGVHPDSYVRS